MKKANTLILILITVLSYTVIGQKEKLETGDSIRVAMEREIITASLVQLRDSIQLSLISFDVQIKKASTLQAIRLNKAKKELLGYQDQVKLDLKEVSGTSQNGWGQDSVERLRTAMTFTRRQHKRICLEL